MWFFWYSQYNSFEVKGNKSIVSRLIAISMPKSVCSVIIYLKQMVVGCFCWASWRGLRQSCLCRQKCRNKGGFFCVYIMLCKGIVSYFYFRRMAWRIISRKTSHGETQHFCPSQCLINFLASTAGYTQKTAVTVFQEHSYDYGPHGERGASLSE